MQLCTLYLNGTYCIPNDDIQKFQWGLGWGFPFVATSTLAHYSVRVFVWLVIALPFDCRRTSPGDWPLLQQVGFSLHDCLSQSVTFEEWLMSLKKQFKWNNTRSKILFCSFFQLMLLGGETDWINWNRFCHS